MGRLPFLIYFMCCTLILLGTHYQSPVLVAGQSIAGCLGRQFLCNTTRLCVDTVDICDFYDDCGDNSDESNCAHNLDCIAERENLEVIRSNCLQSRGILTSNSTSTEFTFSLWTSDLIITAIKFSPVENPLFGQPGVYRFRISVIESSDIIINHLLKPADVLLESVALPLKVPLQVYYLFPFSVRVEFTSEPKNGTYVPLKPSGKLELMVAKVKNCSNAGRECLVPIRRTGYLEECNNSDDMGLFSQLRECEVLPQCASSEFGCIIGNCIPSVHVCDGFYDCADMSDENNPSCYSEEEYNCQEVSQILQFSVCNVAAIHYVVSSSPSFQNYVTPRLENLYLTRIEANPESIECGTYRINITTTVSRQRATFFLNACQTRSSLAMELRTPLAITPGENITMTVESSMDAIAFPFEIKEMKQIFADLEIIELQMSCDQLDVSCLNDIFSLEERLTGEPGNCHSREIARFLMSNYIHCSGSPSFLDVTRNMTARRNSLVRLDCISSGVPTPSVQWYGELFAEGLSGYSSTGVSSVYVQFNATKTSSATCQSENLYGKVDETVYIKPMSNACEQKVVETYINMEYISSSCLSPLTFSALVENTNPGNFSFQTFLEGAVTLYNISVSPGAFGYPTNEYEFFSSNFRLTVSLNGLLKYFRQYKNYILSPLKRIDLVFLPPLSLEAGSLSINISSDFNHFSINSMLGSSEGSTAFFVAAEDVYIEGLVCPSDIDTICSQRLREAVEYLDSDCFQSDVSTEVGLLKKQFQVLQHCFKTYFKEPVILQQPTMQQDVSSYQSPRVQCITENAVRVEWFIKRWYGNISTPYSGNVLNFKVDYNFQQGQYFCVGYGGGEFSDVNATSDPVMLVSTEFTTFLVTANYPSLTYNDTLQNPDSDWYQIHEGSLRNYFFEVVASNLSFPISGSVEEIKSGSPGIIADMQIMVQQVPAPRVTLPSAEVIMQMMREAIINSQSKPYLVVDLDSVEVKPLSFCPAETIEHTMAGNLTFPETSVGGIAESSQKCSSYTAHPGVARGTRICEGDFIQAAAWSEPNLQSCYDENDDVQTSLVVLTEEIELNPVSEENVVTVSRDLADLTIALGEDYVQMDASIVLTDVAIILESIENVGSTSPEVTSNVIETVDHILNLDPDQFAATDPRASSSILASLEQQLTNVQENGQNFTDYRPNLGVSALRVDKSAFTTGITFATLFSSSSKEGVVDGDITKNDSIVTSQPKGLLGDNIRASVNLPLELIDLIPEDQRSSIPVTFVIHRRGSLFQGGDANDLESLIIAATLEGYTVKNLPPQSPVITKFAPKTVSGATENSIRKCVFWDFLLNDGNGAWSDEGCELVTNAFDDDGSQLHECHCNHLTNFAVLVDIQGDINNAVLDILGIIGLVISIIALVIVIVTFLSSEKLRSKRPQQILIQLCIALLGLYITFLIGIERTTLGVGCVIFGALIHFFCLASVAWMCVEATNMYLLFVKVLNNQVSHFMLKAFLVAWGVPAVVVTAMAIVNPKDYNNGSYCFPYYNTYTFYICIVGLILAMLVYNAIIFILVIRQLTCARVAIANKEQNWDETLRRFQNAVAISVLLGLTWAFGFLSISGAQFVANLLFLIFNSLQGLFVFLLFALRSKEVRDLWKEWLTCACFKESTTSAYYKGASTSGSYEVKKHQKGGKSHSESTNSTYPDGIPLSSSNADTSGV